MSIVSWVSGECKKKDLFEGGRGWERIPSP